MSDIDVILIDEDVREMLVGEPYILILQVDGDILLLRLEWKHGIGRIVSAEYK